MTKLTIKNDTDNVVNRSSLNLKNLIVKGFFWIMIATVGVNLLTQVTIFILAEFLSPSEFGLITILTLVLNFARIIGVWGLDKAVIYKAGKIDDIANTAFVITGILGGGVYLTLFLISPLIANFFENPQLTAILRIVSITLVIFSLSVVPSAILERELLYRRKVWPEILSMASYSFVAITLAISGLGIWSVVLAMIGQSFVSTTLMFIVARWYPKLSFKKLLAPELLKYGKDLLGISILVAIYLNIDNALIGRISGTEALGFYAFAFSIANLPTRFMISAINRISFPAYVKLQDDLVGLSRLYLKSLKMTSLITFPATLGLAAVAAPLLTTLYGSKWVPSIGLIYILAFYAFFRSISALPTNLFLALGKQTVALEIQFVITILTALLATFATLLYGPLGTALTMVGTLAIGTMVWLIRVNAYLPLTFSTVLKTLAPQTAISFLMAGLIFSFSIFLPKTGISVVLGFVTFGVVFYFLGVTIATGGKVYYDFQDIAKIYIGHK